MLLSLRDVAVPPDEVLFFDKSLQIETYASVILLTLLVYDSCTLSVLLLRFLSWLTFYQSAHLTKRYVIESLRYNSG